MSCMNVRIYLQRELSEIEHTIQALGKILGKDPAGGIEVDWADVLWLISASLGDGE